MSGEVFHTIGEPITLRYDGLDADEHIIELISLGDSIKGMGRIIGVASNFAVTQKFVQQQNALSVRVVAKPPEAHCYELVALVQWASQNGLASTIVGGLTVSLIGYIFSRLAGNKAEMKELRTALETAIKEIGNRDQKVVDRLLDTVDKMADSLRPAAKQAVAPIGKTASTLSVLSSSPLAKPITIGAAEKEAIESTEALEIGDEKTYRVLIHEMNMDTATCKVAFDDAPEERTAAVITDPVATIANNVYAVAFAGQNYISVRAKAAIRDGKVEKLFISNTA